MSFKNLTQYFVEMVVKFHFYPSITGFVLVVLFMCQIISGIDVALSLIPETTLIPIIRAEEDIETPYIDIFFWMHERGVDALFLVFYAHLARKLYLEAYRFNSESSWKAGVIAFLFFHVVVFLGLVICDTHLSDITLSIACNIMHTLFGFYGKPYAIIFPHKNLNTDTLIRMAYLHYITGFIVVILGIGHALDMHFD